MEVQKQRFSISCRMESRWTKECRSKILSYVWDSSMNTECNLYLMSAWHDVFALRASQSSQKLMNRAGKNKTRHCHHTCVFYGSLKYCRYCAPLSVHSIYLYPLQSMFFLPTHNHHTSLNISSIHFIGRNE